ncbi:MAG: GNAT family N-acetyltransferase [Clostridia bacterium]|nr:GNAT family N-acetyltransferase [Clostridia bacterium]
MKIVQAEAKDLKQILELQYNAFKDVAAKLGEDIEPLNETLAQLTDEYRKGIILKAVNYDREIIGSVRAYTDTDCTHIVRLIVRPDCQRQGVGGALLREIERLCPAEKYELFTAAGGSGIELYKKNGYIPYSEEKKSDKLTMVHMCKESVLYF